MHYRYSQTSMSKKLMILFLLYFTVDVTFCYQRNINDVVLQVDRMEKLAGKIVKLLYSGVTEGANETMHLQDIMNNLQLDFQDSIYVFYRFVDSLPDGKTRRIFVSFIAQAQLNIYNSEKAINNVSPTQIKKAIKDTLEGIIKILPIARAVVTQAVEKLPLITSNLAIHSYDVVLFTFVGVYVRIKYCQVSNTDIGKDIEANLENIYASLKQISSATLPKLNEFSTFAQLLCKFGDKIINKIERWGYIYNTKTQQAEIISGVSYNLVLIVEKYRRHVQKNPATAELIKHLKQFLGDLASEVEKLAKVVERTNKQEEDIFNDVLLEILISASTLGSKLELLLENA